MKLEKLTKTGKSSKKRVGRGYGSGKGGHTSGRGQKGQKSRSKVGLLFEGTKMRKSLIRRIPFLRGKGRFSSLKNKPITINLRYLNVFSDNQEVTLESLAKNKLVVLNEAKKFGVKILGDGELTKKLIIRLPISKSAAIKLEKAGGKVEGVKESGKKPVVLSKPAKKQISKASKEKKVVKKTTKK